MSEHEESLLASLIQSQQRLTQALESQTQVLMDLVALNQEILATLIDGPEEENGGVLD